jgi:peptidoglycan/LPS O-acetylase OafA/YrhL
LCDKEIKQKTFFSITEILGNYTYSIYIWSYMVLLVIYKLTQTIFKLENITTANANLFLFANTLWISVLVGFISYYTIEKPFLKLKER